MNTKSQLILAVARHLGMPVVMQKYQGWLPEYRDAPKDVPFWDGRLLYVNPERYNPSNFHGPDDVLHEIGHWLESTKEQRCKVNFGLTDDDHDREDKADEIAQLIDRILAAIVAEVEWMVGAR